jgi:hypothetical protein
MRALAPCQMCFVIDRDELMPKSICLSVRFNALYCVFRAMRMVGVPGKCRVSVYSARQTLPYHCACTLIQRAGDGEGGFDAGGGGGGDVSAVGFDGVFDDTEA